jgi:hypothetical protein
LFADVILDVVDLVRGARHASAALPAKQADTAAARTWIRNGNIGVLTFNDCCGWLGWDGCCGSRNYRTLCVPRHRAETRKLRARQGIRKGGKSLIAKREVNRHD